MPNDDTVGRTCSFDVCSKCKVMCCIDANPPLTPERKEIIVQFLLQQGLPHENVFIDEAYLHPSADEHGYCAFYDKEAGKCRIHSVKPETCRAGPITFDINLRTGKLEWYLKKGSICALADCLRVDDDKFKGHFEVAKAEIVRLISKLDADSLGAILKIGEPETVKIGENDLPQETKLKLILL